MEIGSKPQITSCDILTQLKFTRTEQQYFRCRDILQSGRFEQLLWCELRPVVALRDACVVLYLSMNITKRRQYLQRSVSCQAAVYAVSSLLRKHPLVSPVSTAAPGYSTQQTCYSSRPPRDNAPAVDRDLAQDWRERAWAVCDLLAR